MILALDVARYSIKLAEVDSEKEAFAEMCRYLEVNDIFSDATSVDIGDWTDSEGNMVEYINGHSKTVDTPSYKTVRMNTHPSWPCDDNLGSIRFRIYYSKQPDYQSMEDAISGSCEIDEGYQKYLDHTQRDIHPGWCPRFREQRSPTNCLENPKFWTEIINGNRYPRQEIHNRSQWIFDEYNTYMNDLKNRTALRLASSIREGSLKEGG